MDDRDLRQTVTADELSPEYAYERSLALLFRMAILANDDLDFESALWNGISETYNRHYPDRTVDVHVEVVESQRAQVLEEALSKLESHESLTDTELRVLLEDPDTDYADVRTHVLRRHMASPQQLTQYVREHPTVIGGGFEVIDQGPTQRSTDTKPDLVGRDADGNIVLVEVNARSDRDAVATSVEGLEYLIQDYGGEDRVRGVLVSVEPAKSLDVLLEGSPVEYRSLAEQFDLEDR
ncbi:MULTISPECIES: endonuclease NucS domain-containing protein [unclassified Haloferax]|uniref:endonuclease NucS domain-containing protein n=1 Tax=unclassified Haloferax TaxID=2625095 RepID=UPI0028755ED0|nr:MULTISPECIES: endonuclease NucS domain-containing protein [unclassified Haloferax]MDS0243394.1 endonuclease NucS [Haloferax sp. S2CR25]MDS0446515.1 endonuclease NucS [Haloferax sp. S2CR25-2]